MLSTTANLFRFVMWSSGECIRADILYHSVIARRNEFGVAKSRFGRCSPKARFRFPSTQILRGMCIAP